MKKSLLAIALGLAVMPLTFAQTTPANPPATGSQEGTTKAKKHAKKNRKAKKTTGTASKVAPATSNPTK